MTRPPNWTKIKAEYLKGGVSYRQLAEKHGVSARTIERRASSESWAAACREVVGSVSAELPARIAGEILDESAAWVAESLRMARQLRAEVWAKRSGSQTKIVASPAGPIRMDLPLVNEAKDLRAYVAALLDVDKLGRVALGIDATKLEVSGPDGGPLEVEVSDARQRLADRLRGARQEHDPGGPG
jgi:transposase-like protein